jgi:hypothetical protein
MELFASVSGNISQGVGGIFDLYKRHWGRYIFIKSRLGYNTAGSLFNGLVNKIVAVKIISLYGNKCLLRPDCP